MSRVQLALNVSNLDEAIDFYSKLFATGPAKVRPGYAVSKEGGKVLYRSGETFGIVETSEGKKSGDGKIKTETLMAMVDPRREWGQMFDEAWRINRDYFYDPGMHGADWRAAPEYE